MKNKLLVAICLFLVLIFAGCNVTTQEPTNPTPEVPTPEIPEEQTPNVIKEYLSDDISHANESFYQKYLPADKQLYYTLWQDNTSISYKIDIEPSELYAMSQAFELKGEQPELLETYRKCNLTITVNGVDYFYEEVGIRMHGNTSKRAFCDANGIMYALVNFRFSFNETFDGDEYEGTSIYHDWQRDTEEGKAARKERKDRTFATMKKCYIKWNRGYDRTYSREAYCSRILWNYGIINPHVTCANLAVTQQGSMQNVGVGMLYETIDKQFLDRYFPESEQGGDLYKCLYQEGKADFSKFESYGIETASWTPNYDLKTNDDPDEEGYSTHARLEELITQLYLLDKEEESFTTEIEKLVNMDYFTQLEAVNYLLGNPDCIRNNYNNFYTYFVPNQPAMLGVYDYDWSMGNVWSNEVRCENISPTAIRGAIDECSNPLYRKTILDGGHTKYQELFLNKLQNVLDGEWFTVEKYDSVVKNYYNIYHAQTQPSQVLQSTLTQVDIGRLTFDLNDKSATNYITAKRQTASNGKADNTVNPYQRTYTVYFDNTGTNWQRVYIWSWGGANGDTRTPMVFDKATNLWVGEVNKDCFGFLFYVGEWTYELGQTVNIQVGDNIANVIYSVGESIDQSGKIKYQVTTR